ncbi:MAG TPA: DNA topoisomerase IB [Actinomycetota bacterium]|nr:DNA topoisomerase IB [Actinomycetota bacterium]
MRTNGKLREDLDDPAQASREAGLRYVHDGMSGIRRMRSGRGFRYLDPQGRPIRDGAQLERVEALVIPPAWTDVWVCPSPRGHLQVTGRDARGRKQYRYHPEWRRIRDERKYDRMLAFATALPEIRRRTAADLERTGLPREKVLAAVVRLLETTLIRVGNDEYARENGSYGLTTLRDRHVGLDGGTVMFDFQGKGGKRHQVEVDDPRLAGILKRCRDLPGYELFQYVDEDGERRSIDSEDVNDYLREISGQGFTAKDFRTWAGTVIAAWALAEVGAFDSEAHAKRNIAAAVKRVAGHLGNTPAISRSSYIHPAVFDAYLDGSVLRRIRRRADERLGDRPEDLTAAETAVLALLRRRLAKEEKRAAA